MRRLRAAGLALVWLGFYTASLPAIYAQSSFWTSSPTYFAIRVGRDPGGFAALYAVAQVAEPVRAWRSRRSSGSGGDSLFVYWIHVELVYGYATWPLHRRLPLWGAGLAYVVVHRVDVLGGRGVRSLEASAGRRLLCRANSSAGVIPGRLCPVIVEQNCTDLVIALN